MENHEQYFKIFMVLVSGFIALVWLLFIIEVIAALVTR